jgi:PIN domain nuclease of toxin-antitoxin system
MNKPVVLDASAVLALLHRESGSPLVAEHMERGAIVSTVNLAEIISKQQGLGIPPEEMIALLQLIGADIHVFDEEAAIRVGLLKNATKSLGLSLGDRACIALGQSLDCPVLTADRIWTKMNFGIEIILIR